jgi:hypothetical protein
VRAPAATRSPAGRRESAAPSLAIATVKRQRTTRRASSPMARRPMARARCRWARSAPTSRARVARGLDCQRPIARLTPSRDASTSRHRRRHARPA